MGFPILFWTCRIRVFCFTHEPTRRSQWETDPSAANHLGSVYWRSLNKALAFCNCRSGREEERRKTMSMWKKVFKESVVRQPWRMIASRRSSTSRTTTNISAAIDSFLLRSLKEHYLEVSKMNPPPVIKYSIPSLSFSLSVHIISVYVFLFLKPYKTLWCYFVSWKKKENFFLFSFAKY